MRVVAPPQAGEAPLPQGPTDNVSALSSQYLFQYADVTSDDNLFDFLDIDYSGAENDDYHDHVHELKTPDNLGEDSLAPYNNYKYDAPFSFARNDLLSAAGDHLSGVAVGNGRSAVSTATNQVESTLTKVDKNLMATATEANDILMQAAAILDVNPANADNAEIPSADLAEFNDKPKITFTLKPRDSWQPDSELVDTIVDVVTEDAEDVKKTSPTATGGRHRRPASDDTRYDQLSLPPPKQRKEVIVAHWLHFLIIIIIKE